MSKMGKPRRNGGGGVAENMMMEFDRSFFDDDNDDQYQQQNYDAGGGGADDNDENYDYEGYNNDDEDHQEMEMEGLTPNSRMGLEAYQSTNLNPEMLDYLHEDQARESDFQPYSSETESEDRDDGDDDMLGYAKVLGSGNTRRKDKYSFRYKGGKGKERPKNDQVCHPSIVILHQIKFPNRVNIFKTVNLRQKPYCTFLLDENAFLKKIKLSNEKNRLVCRRTTFKTPNQQEFGFKDPRFKNFRFICSVCNGRYNSSSHLKRHWTKKHDNSNSRKHIVVKNDDDFAPLYDPTQDKPYICSVCKKGFSSPHHLKQHLTIHGIGKDVIKCKYCSYTGSKYIVEKHMKNKKSCSKKLSSDSKKILPPSTAGAGAVKKSPFTCVFCNKTLSEKRGLRRHIQRLHKNEKMPPAIVTVQSDKPKPGPASSKILLKPQTITTPFTAKIRPGPASSKMTSTSINKPGPSSSKSNPHQHQGISLILKPRLRKPAAGPASSKLSKPGPASFKSGVNVKNDTQDQDLNRFYCTVCDDSFTDKLKLTRHMMKDHVTVKSRKSSLGDFTCKFCSASSFKTELELDEHYEKHEDPQDFSCILCPSKRFGDIYLLRKHVKRSHNERTLTIFCQICSKGFVKEFGLYLHLQTTHAKEKVVRISPSKKETKPIIPTTIRPFKREPKPIIPKIIEVVQCLVCTDTFATNTLMRRHLKRIHMEKKILTVKCPKCVKMFVNEHGLRCHLQSVHGIPKSKLQNYILSHDIEVDNDYSQDQQDLDQDEVMVNEEGVVDVHKDFEVYNDIDNDQDQYENPETENYEIDEQNQKNINVKFTCQSCDSVFYTEKLYQQHVKWICQNDSFSSTPVFSNYTPEGDISLGDAEIMDESNDEVADVDGENLEKENSRENDQNQNQMFVDDDQEGDFRCDVCLKSFILQENFEQHVRESVKCQEF